MESRFPWGCYRGQPHQHAYKWQFFRQKRVQFIYSLHNELRWLLISLKELWMKTESARSTLRTTARSTCKYTFTTYQLPHIVYLDVNRNRWLFSVHFKHFTFCPHKYGEPRQKLVDLSFANFTITKWKLVEVVINRRSDFVYWDWLDKMLIRKKCNKRFFSALIVFPPRCLFTGQ